MAAARERQHVVLYAKPGCHLCDDARALLDDLAASLAPDAMFLLDERDIRLDPDLFDRYRLRIPVITVDGREVAEGRLDDAMTQTLVRELTTV